MRGLSVLLLLPCLCLGAETPQELIARAIVAHGGKARLSGTRAEIVQLKCVHFVGTTEVPFTNTLTLQLPDRFKSVVEMGNSTIISCLNGDRVQMRINGQPQTPTAAQIAQIRQTLNLDYVMRLVPLIEDKGVTLTPLGEYTIQGEPVVGLVVKRPGLAEVKLFFDKRTALLRVSEYTIESPGTVGIVQQARYTDHRDAGGYVRPGKMTVYRDGKKIMEAVLTEARRVERIDPGEFRIP
jgi:hypothetical protein